MLQKALIVLRRAGAVGITLATVLMTIMTGGTAFATEHHDVAKPATQTFNVTLAPSEHGKLQFTNSKDTTANITSGNSVNILVRSDKGYQNDSISAVNPSGNTVSLHAARQFTFTPTSDTVLTAHFTAQGQVDNTHVSATRQPLADSDVLQYIKQHANSKYTGKGDHYELANMLTVNSLLVDGATFKGKTIDDVWFKDMYDSVLSSTNGIRALYRTSPNAKYYVGKIGNLSKDLKVIDEVAGRNDTSGTVYKDVVYDRETGLVYVPAARFGSRANAVRVQLLYVTRKPNATADISVQVKASGIQGDLARTGVLHADAKNYNTVIQLANNDKAADSINSRTIDSVQINGIPYSANAHVWSYDTASGALTVNAPTIDINSVNITLSNNWFKNLSNFFGLTAKAAGVPSIGNKPWTFDKTPAPSRNHLMLKGWTRYFDGRHYCPDNNGGKGCTPLLSSPVSVYAGSPGIDEMLKALVNNGPADANMWASSATSTDWITLYSTIAAQKIDSGGGNMVDIPAYGKMWPGNTEARLDTGGIGLACSHLKVGDNAPLSGKVTVNLNARILSVDTAKHTMLVAFFSPRHDGQTGVGMFTVPWTLRGGYVSLIKTSAKPDVTKNNSAYDMTGAKYGIYKDITTANKVAELTVQNNTGVTNESPMLTEGTYYVKEIAKPDGTSYAKHGYIINKTVRAIHVTSGAHTPITLDGDMAERPVNDPMNLVVQKAVAGESAAGVAPGNVTLEGVKFRVDYYNNVYDSVKSAQASGAPKASAVFATNDKGFLMFGSSKPIDSTSWPYTTGGQNHIPLGTVIMTEISASEGLQVYGDPQAFTITDDNGNGIVDANEHHTLGTWPNVTHDTSKAFSAIGPDQVNGGGVIITKAESDWNKSQDEGDGSLAGINYQITNESKNAVQYNGKTIQPGEVVTTITTKYDDHLKAYVAKTDNVTWQDGAYKVDTSQRNIELEYGDYSIKEMNSEDDSSANSSHINAQWTQHFSVRQDGSLEEYNETNGNWNVNKIWHGEIRVGKADRETGQYLQLGAAHLDGSLFNVINKSAHAVQVNGTTYQPDQKIMTIATQWHDGKAYATTGKVLPYGTYQVVEVKSGEGYLFDSTSKSWTATLTQHTHNGTVDLLDESKVVKNQVVREDWNFKKKDTETQDRMARVAFQVYSNTTGETHYIVTDENGTWGSSWNAHTHNTNANDPDSPITNGAIKINTDGRPYVADESKLDPDAGTWFTGIAQKDTEWQPNGTSYQVNGETVNVQDDKRAFPYDTYTVREMPSRANMGHRMVTFTVTMHKYGDPDGKGIDLDYGTVDDDVIHIGTTLSSQYGKIVPATGDTSLTDTVMYKGLSSEDHYTLEGELHAVDNTGKDLGVIAKASKQFTATASIGKVDVPFTHIDMTKIQASKLVAFENLKDEQGNTIANHKDIHDEGQTVNVPHIGTTLNGDIDHESNAQDKTITLTDTVNYTGLEVGKNYTMTGVLMDKTTGKPVVDADGKTVTATTTFAPTQSQGSVNVVFKFTSKTLQGKTVVAFEHLSSNDVEFAVHTDINDHGQTITFPKVGTTAKDKVDDDHIINQDAKQTIIDTVHASNLIVGKQYTVNGALHLQNVDDKGDITDGGVLKDVQGHDITASTTFTATSANMDVQVPFTVDASHLEGRTLVAFENLSRNGVTVGVHADITDKEQSILVPKIGTTLTADNGTHMVQAFDKNDNNTQVVSNMLKSVEKQSKQNDTQSSTGQNGESIVKKTVTDKIHETDSTASGKLSKPTTSGTVNNHVVTLTDKVAYENLAVGKQYTVNGVLHLQNVDDKGNITDGGVLKDAQGHDVVGSTTFTPDKPNGTVDVKFTFDDTQLEGKSTVAYETVTHDGKTVTTHTDIKDKGQTVTFVNIHTTAVDSATTTHTMIDAPRVTINDTVNYTGLTVNKQYTLNGVLHLQNIDSKGNVIDGGVLKDAQGHDVTAHTNFVAKTPEGKATVVFTFTPKPGVLDGRTVVAFETLNQNGVTIAVHTNINDHSQSVHKVKLGTTLTGDNNTSKVVNTGANTKLVDTVKFTNLNVGESYTVQGKLVDTQGKVLRTRDGKPVTAQTKFTPQQANGIVRLQFTLDTTSMTDGAHIVAFERAYSANGTLVGKHEDVHDKGQTILLKKPPVIPTVHVNLQTGVGGIIITVMAALAVIVIIMGSGVWFMRRKRS